MRRIQGAPSFNRSFAAGSPVIRSSRYGSRSAVMRGGRLRGMNVRCEKVLPLKSQTLNER